MTTGEPVPLLSLLLLVPALAGGLFAWFGWRSVRLQLRRRREWRPERGTVVDHHWAGNHDNRIQYWVLERTDARGQVHRRTTDFGVGHGTLRPFPFDIDILVDPQDEARFVPAGGCRSGMAGLLFVVIGAVFVLAGSVAFFYVAVRPALF